LAVIAFVSFKNTFYTSDWHSPDSNFYQNTSDALRQSNISLFQGSIPTLVVFWRMNDPDSEESLLSLKSLSKDINIVGVHLQTDGTKKMEARKWWAENVSPNARIYFDDNNMLENTFVVRTAPANFLFFPKSKKLLVHNGNIRWAAPTIPSLIKTTETAN